MKIMIVHSWNAPCYNFYVEMNATLYNLDAYIKQTQSAIVISLTAATSCHVSCK